jgi:putative DNA primase/helicase
MVTTGGGDGGTKERESLCLAVAEWAAAGFAIILIRPDGSKAPLTIWKTIAEGSQPPPTVESLTDQIRKGLCDGIAVVTGVASGNAEMIEIEGRAAERLDEIVMHAEATGVGHLLERLLSGCVEASPSGGMHFVFRVTDGPALGNTSLACRPDPTKPRGRLVLAETRGQGGYMIVAASFGRTHDTGKPYAFLEGSPANTPTFTAAERDELHRLKAVVAVMKEYPMTMDGHRATTSTTRRRGTKCCRVGPAWLQAPTPTAACGSIGGGQEKPWELQRQRVAKGTGFLCFRRARNYHRKKPSASSPRLRI